MSPGIPPVHASPINSGYNRLVRLPKYQESPLFAMRKGK